MFFYIVLTPIFNTSGLCSTGNTRKCHQIDVYIYQCDKSCLGLKPDLAGRHSERRSGFSQIGIFTAAIERVNIINGYV